jgi:hypothetical protein
MNGTVLMVKRYPSEEFAVLIDNSPAVISLRDVQYSNPRANQMITEGARILVHDIGTWNVRTCAMHRACLSLVQNKDTVYNKPFFRTYDNKQEKKSTVGEKRVAMQAVVVEYASVAHEGLGPPIRKQRRSMME